MPHWSPPPTASRGHLAGTWPATRGSASRYGCRAGSRPRSRCSRARATAMSAARHCTATTGSPKSIALVGTDARRSADRAARLRRRRRSAAIFSPNSPAASFCVFAGRSVRLTTRRLPTLRVRPSHQPASRDPNQIMYLPFTSGTTGTPKGVLHSDNTLLASARMMARDWRLDERCALHAEPAVA